MICIRAYVAPSGIHGLGLFSRDPLRRGTLRPGVLVLCGDEAISMNHDDEPNCDDPAPTLTVARRDIAPGEQLTSDDAALNLEEGFRCLCGVAGCRGWVSGDRFEGLASAWDALIRDAFPKIPEVDQPLWDPIADEAAVRRAVADPACLPSIPSTRFTGGSVPASARRVAI